MLTFDIAGFTRPDRDEETRMYIHKAFYWILREALQRSGVPWDRCHHEDRGDGALVIAPPDITAHGIIYPLPERPRPRPPAPGWYVPLVADYREINRANWDDRVPVHLTSDYYRVRRFLADPDFISDVVRFDLPRLGAVSGVRGVHLQCHIGTDTISLARLGASMTGLDFSGAAVEAARKLAAEAGADTTFVQSDVYAAADVLGAGGFGLVYTGVGALPWLPDIRRWGRVVAALLSPGGRLFIREDHPVLLSAKVRDGLLTLQRPYFEQPDPNVADSSATYAGADATLGHTVTNWWNHGIGEVITSLLDAGLRITGFTEHDSVPWPALPGAMEHIGGGEYRLAENPQRLPHTYTLQAVKDGTS